MDAGDLIPKCLTPMGVAVIWLGHWGLFAAYAYKTKGRVRFRDVFDSDVATFLASIFLPLFTAPLWVPAIWFLGAMFGVKCS